MSFNPRPSLLTDESRCQPAGTMGDRAFQSTSVIADGRKAGSPPTARPCPCFNPRPSLLTDERDEVEAVGAGDDVSIHVRHC